MLVNFGLGDMLGKNFAYSKSDTNAHFLYAKIIINNGDNYDD